MPDINDVRDKYPDYADLSDQQLLDGLHQKYYSDLPKEDFYQKFSFQPAEEDKPGEFTKGLKRGLDQTGALLTEAVPAYAKGVVNQAIGHTFDNRQNLEDFQKKNSATEAANPAAVPSYQDNHGIGDLGKYIAGAAGEQVPSLAVGLLGGGIGGKVAEAGLEDLAATAGKTLSQSEMNQVIGKGAAVGAAASMAPTTVPQQYMDFLSKGRDDPMGATMFGALQLGVMALPQANVFTKLFGADVATEAIGNSFLKTLGKEAAEGAEGEAGATPAPQAADKPADKSKDKPKK